MFVIADIAIVSISIFPSQLASTQYTHIGRGGPSVISRHLQQGKTINLELGVKRAAAKR
jgi:hypothetical protein